MRAPRDPLPLAVGLGPDSSKICGKGRILPLTESRLKSLRRNTVTEEIKWLLRTEGKRNAKEGGRNPGETEQRAGWE